MSSLAASLLYRFELASPWSVFVIALVLTGAGLSIARPMGGTEPSREGRGYLLAAMVASAAVVVVPFANVGAQVADGVAYRAYFSADLMTHLSVVAELQKGEFPLSNPFYRGDTLGYYWLFFVFPATFASFVGNQSALILIYASGGLLFAGLLYVVLDRFTRSPRRALFGVLVLLGAVSYEGVFAWSRSEPWTNVNVDALARWAFELVSLDGLHRGLLYTPQHLFSYSLLLVLILLLAAGEPKKLVGALVAGLLLGGMAGTSIVTAMLAGPWLVFAMWRRRRDRDFFRVAIVVGVSSLALLGYYVSLGFFDDAGGALTVRIPRPGELFAILLLDAGALTVLALTRRKREPLDFDLLVLAGFALFAALTLDLTGYEGVWMAWRAGSVFLVALGLFAVRALAPWHLAVVAPAALTLVLDVYNAADISNRSLSPGDFPWTTVVPTDEHLALEWVRRETPPGAVVQWDTRARGPGEWALVPALGERRMAVGSPIFLLDLRKYRVRERRHVRPIFASGDAELAHRLAVEQGIDYLIVGPEELRVRGERVRPLFEAPERFRSAFESGEASVLEVLPP